MSLQAWRTMAVVLAIEAAAIIAACYWIGWLT